MVSVEGLTYWGAASGFAGTISALATKLFAGEDKLTKLLVFFVVIILILILALGGTYFVEDNELSGGPVPPGESVSTSSNINPGNSPLLFLLSDAIAQPSEKWIYCGKYDSARQRWLEGNLAFDGHNPDSLINQRLRIGTGTDVFDSLPRFSRLSLRWTFGETIEHLGSGQRVTILDTATLGKNRIWCKVNYR